EPAGVKKGVYDAEDGKITITTDKDAGALSDAEEDDERMYDSVVVIRREGEAIFPVDIQIVFEDGEVLWEHWDGEYRWVKFNYTRPAKVKYAQVDPENKILLDISFGNNSRKQEPEHRTALKWSSQVMFWVQHWLQILAAFC